MKKIVLASTSPYRKAQLESLGVPFECLKPKINEDDYKEEALIKGFSPQELAQFLSHHKAHSLATQRQITIGGDQLVQLGLEILGKPHSRLGAIEQLLKMQNNTHQLITAVSVFDELKETTVVNVTHITLKKLTQKQIEHYVDTDKPFDCAGSYKIEKHGIQLIEKIETTDYTAIQGLPLLSLSMIFQKIGISIPYN